MLDTAGALTYHLKFLFSLDLRGLARWGGKSMLTVLRNLLTVFFLHLPIYIPAHGVGGFPVPHALGRV